MRQRKESPQATARRRAPVPLERREQVEEVRRRLQTGELDSDLAIVETAFALLDGDCPRLPPRRP
jgi:hypothetical protein